MLATLAVATGGRPPAALCARLMHRSGTVPGQKGEVRRPIAEVDATAPTTDRVTLVIPISTTASHFSIAVHGLTAVGYQRPSPITVRPTRLPGTSCRSESGPCTLMSPAA